MALTSPRATGFGFPTAPVFWSDVPEWIRKVAEVVNSLRGGKINATGTVTLTENAATTTLSDTRIGRTTKVVLVQTTANAAAALASTYQTYPNAATEAAVLNHANNAQTDRTFAYCLLG